MRFNKSKGFSLIEALIAAFVFATGILGAAGLQMKSLSMLSNSSSVNAAMFGVNDLADRMRANPTGVEAGAYDDLDESVNAAACAPACTPTQLANNDVAAVYERLTAELSSATLDVSKSADNMFTLAVTWTERAGDVSTTKSHTVAIVPFIYEI